MKPASFEYIRAESLEDALQVLNERGEDARPLAGGQSLAAMMNFRMAMPEALVDITRIPGLDYVEDRGGSVAIGAASSHTTAKSSETVLRCLPLMAEAFEHVAHHAVRNRGTLGGNVCHHDPASEMPLALTLLDATFVAKNSRGERRIAAAEFFVDAFETALTPDELLVEIEIPKQHENEVFAFEELAVRKGDYAIIATGFRAHSESGTLTNVRAGLVGGGGTILRVPSVEAALEGTSGGDAAIDRAIAALAAAIEPTGDVHATAEDKADLAEVLMRRAISRAVATPVTAAA